MKCQKSFGGIDGMTWQRNTVYHIERGIFRILIQKGLVQVHSFNKGNALYPVQGVIDFVRSKIVVVPNKEVPTHE
jgi:hypothetical protein